MQDDLAAALNVEAAWGTESAGVEESSLPSAAPPKGKKGKFRPEIRAVRKAQLCLLLFIFVVMLAYALQRFHPAAHTVVSVAMVAFLYSVVTRSERDLLRSPPVASLGYGFVLQVFQWIMAIACGIFVVSLVVSWLGPWRSARFLTEASKMTVERSSPLGNSFWAIVNLAILAPMYEELFFRGYFLNVCRPIGDRFAIVLSALLFAAGHLVFFNALYTFVLGLFWAILTVRYNSILPSLFCHMLNNFVAACLPLWRGSAPSSAPGLSGALAFSRTIVNAQPWLSLIVGAVLLAVLYIVWRICKRLRRQSEKETALVMTIYEAVRVLFHWPVVLMIGSFALSLIGWGGTWGKLVMRFLK